MLLDDCIESFDTFLYGEADGTGGQYGGYGADGFTYYNLNVLDDSEDLLEKGTAVAIAANSMLAEFYPKLEKGMRVVVPIKKDGKKEGRYFYIVDGCFTLLTVSMCFLPFRKKKGKKKAGSGWKRCGN